MYLQTNICSTAERGDKFDIIRIIREYLKEEEKLTRQIKSFTPEIHRLTGEDLYLARRRLMCLYEMRSDVRAVARKLENYYDKGDMRPVYRKH